MNNIILLARSMRLSTYVISIIGFAFLTILTLFLFSVSFVESLEHNSSITISKTLVILVLLYRIVSEARLNIFEKSKAFTESYIKKRILLNFISVFLGTILTFAINIEMGLGPVVAASTVAILATLFFPKYDVPIYCGAFVGMACPSVFYNYPLISLAGITAGILFIVAKNAFNGYGGKLGTIALGGCVATTLATRTPLGLAGIPPPETHLTLIIYSSSAALLTYLLNVRLKNSPVISSGIIGLVGGLLLPVIHPEHGQMLAIMVICASFAGMSSKEKVPHEIFIVIAGLFSALFFIYTASYLGGTGGKLGTIAFGSVIAVRGIWDLINKLYTRFKKVP